MHQHRKCRECEAESERIRNARPHRKHQVRITRIVSRYGVSRAMAEHLARAPHCAACLRQFNEQRERNVDHCHATDKIRGVLCVNCNGALGHVNDSPTRLRDLIAYINRSLADSSIEAK